MAGRRTIVFDQGRVPGNGCGRTGVSRTARRWMKGRLQGWFTLMLVTGAGHCDGDCAGCDGIDY